MQKLKEKLLSTGYFINNSYLDEYIDLVSNENTAKYLERHHILPRAYYNIVEQELDNSANNLVSLSFADHCKAHWLLYYCTVGKLQYASQTAFVIMVNGLSKRIKEYTEADFIELQKMKDQLLEDSNTFWSTEEDDFLKQYFLNLTDEELAAQLNRTEIAIRARRSYYGLQRVKMSDFTDEEIDYIITHYQDRQIKEIAAQLNRSTNSVFQKCASLGLRKKAEAWSGEELTFFKQHVATLTVSEMSAYLGRSVLAVRRQCHLTGLSCKSQRPGIWVDTELAYLQANYNTKTVPQMAKILGRPVSSVRRKCLDLKLIEVKNPRKITETILKISIFISYNINVRRLN